MKIFHLACLTLALGAPLFGQSTLTRRFKNESTARMISKMQNAATLRLSANPASSQAGGLSFAPVVNYNAGGLNAYAVAVADFNGDGKADLVVANHCLTTGGCQAGTVGVMLGHGNGTFGAAVNYPSGGVTAYSVTVADVNGDGKLDIVVANTCATNGCSNGMVGVLLGNGDGTFQAAVAYNSGGSVALTVLVADVNLDHKADIVVANAGSGSVGVLLGNGDGTFQQAVSYDSGGTDSDTNSVVVADVNGDGKPDLLTVNVDGESASGSVGVLLGNGDGTFQNAAMYSSGAYGALSAAVKDVNGDGRPDLIVANCGNSGCNGGDGVIGVLLGNGDGTFQVAVPYDSGGYNPNSVAIADVDGDGKPDLICANDGTPATVGVLLGNGDGTFRTAVIFNSNSMEAGGDAAQSLAVADINGDGKPDLVVAGFQFTVGVLINTSTQRTTTALASSLNPSNFGQTVTFTATITVQPGFYKGKPTGSVNFFDKATGIDLGTVALNSNGVATIQTSTLGPSTHSIVATYSGDTNFVSSASPALSQVVLGAAAKLSPTSLTFADQTVNTTSLRQSVTLTNTGDIPLTFNSISFTGTSPTNFSQTNNCGTSLAGGSTCTFSVTFKPTAAGTRNAALTLSDNAPSKLQKIPVSGVGVLPAVTFSPTSLTFPTQVIYTTSKAQTVTLTNSGLGILNITNIAASAQFSQTNNCGSTVAPAGTCTLTVKFHPTSLDALTGSISVTDNAPASPQAFPLTGVGTAIQLMPIGVSFGNQPVGTKSLARTITVSNKSHQAINISRIAIRGADPSDFPFVSTTCGSSLASGASCFVKVAFMPTVTGKRTAWVAVSDDGGGEVQRAGLAGTGT